MSSLAYSIDECQMIFKENLGISYHSLIELNHCRTGFIYLLQDAIFIK